MRKLSKFTFYDKAIEKIGNMIINQIDVGQNFKLNKHKLGCFAKLGVYTFDDYIIKKVNKSYQE